MIIMAILETEKQRLGESHHMTEFMQVRVLN